MKIVADLHTHTIASVHAYATALEMITEASEIGLYSFAITDHGESMHGYPHPYYFMNLHAIPKVMKGVRSAGAVFAGPWTPESAGDFVAGPSHVLPTGGAANMFNGLTPDDFRRRHSFVSFTRADLAETKQAIEAFAQVEGLDAHGRAASIRFS